MSLRPVLTLTALIIILAPQPACAQLNGRLADRPIGVGYIRNFTQAGMVEYIQQLAGSLQVGESILQSAPSQEQLNDSRPDVEVPVNGVSWYMVQGLIPSYETVYFQEVADDADARRLLQANAKMFGPNGRMETEAEGLYRLVSTNSWTMPVPEGQTAEEYVEHANKQYADSGGRSFQQSAGIIEKDGEVLIENTYTSNQYYRFHDNLLFNTTFQELWEMDLPTRESLTSNVSSQNDMGFEVFFERIPVAIKQLGWNMLSASAGTQMQQRDGEDVTDADLRRTSIDFGLGVVRAVMFDVDQASGWLRFATDRELAVRAETTWETRRNSQLTRQLEDISSGHSRFAPILNDGAAATLHGCIRISEDSSELSAAAAAWLQQAIDRATGGDAAMVAAAGQVAESLNAFAEHRVLEGLLKVGWSEGSGGVIYGGLQVDNNPALLTALYRMAVQVPDAPAELTEAFALTESDGIPMIRVTLPPEAVADLVRETSLRPTHLFLAHQNSCLWFALGGENASGMLHQSIARCDSTGLASRAPLLTAHIDVERWLAWPQDDPTGIPGLLLWLDANRFEFPPSPVSQAFMFGRSDTEKPTPLLQRCLDLGGERTGSLTVTADGGGLRASVRLGKSLANYYVARMMDAQESMMKRVQSAAATAQETEEVPVEAAPE